MVSAPLKLDPAFRLLCLVSEPAPGQDSVRESIRNGIDFVSLLELSEAHALRPQLARCLSEIGWEAVPTEVRTALETFQSRHLLWSLGLSHELVTISELFSSSGIPFVTFKGPSLSVLLYGDVARREYSDVDLLVPRSAMKDAENALASLGYANSQGNRDFRSAFLAYQRQYSFVREGAFGAVDLHWEFSSAGLPFPISTDEALKGNHSVSLGRREVPVIGGENLALLLAGHGTKENWRSLNWVGDFAMVMATTADLDWQRIHWRASAKGCGDAVVLGCWLALELLNVPVPPDMTALLHQNTRAGLIAQELMARMRLGIVGMSDVHHLDDLMLCDRPIDRMKAMAARLITPTVGDYHFMPLPRWLWPLYHLTRPIRIATKALRSI